MAISSVSSALGFSTAYPAECDGDSDSDSDSLAKCGHPHLQRVAHQNDLAIGTEDDIEQSALTIGEECNTEQLFTAEEEAADVNAFASQNNLSTVPANAKPDGKIGNFSQGKIGDCFALTALYATAQSPTGRRKLKRSITETSNGVYSVQFAGDPSHQKFTVTQAEVDAARAAKKVSTGDPDVAIFELAIRKYEDLHGQSSSGGNTGQVLQLLNGRPVTQTKTHDTVAARKLIHEAAMNPHGFILTLGCGVNKSTGEPVNRDTDPRSGPNNHAFTVTSIDEKTGTATLANPWDTTKVYTISIDDLASIGKLFSVPNATIA